MALRGDINTFSLSAVGRMIHEEAKTGILKVTSGNQTTEIYFKKGGIVFLSGNVAEDLSLGALLKARDLIDEDRIQKALQLAGTEGKRLGVVLIEQGLVSKENLVRILHYQFKEAVTNMLTWQTGEFEYTDGLGNYVEDIHLTIDPIRLVAEAQKWKEFRNHIPNDQVVFQIKDSRQKLQSMDSDGALRVMLLIDGQRNVNQIMNATGLSRLAVYKALTTLVNHGVIARKTTVQKTPSDVHLNWFAIVEMFWSLLDTLMAVMTAELGRQRAIAYVNSSLRRHPAYESGLNLFQAEDDLATNLSRIKTQGALTLQRVAPEALIEGFMAVVIALLHDAYQVLGFKVVQQMIATLDTVLKQVPAAHRQLAQKINATLKPYAEDEGLLQAAAFSDAAHETDQEIVPSASSSNIGQLNKISASSIIAFYHQTFLLVVQDLEHDIGSQGSSLFARLLTTSEYYDRLLARFDIKSSIADNIKNLRDHISSRGYNLEKETLIQAFQNLLAALFMEEKRLLGPKATRQSLLNLEDNLARIEQDNYAPLKDNLIGFIAYLTPQLGI